MKIKSICLLLSLIFILSFSMISCFGPKNDDPIKEEPDNTEPVSGTENIINVYLIAGQSNAVGYGLDSSSKIAKSDERFVKGFENVLYFGEQERWTGSMLNMDFQPVKLGMGCAADRSGAEIGIASSIADNGGMNAIIKCAWGATHLYPDTQYDISLTQGTWTSPTYIKNNNVDTSENPLIGNMYNRFEDTVTKAIKLLIEDGYTPVIKGVWWMQGEAEMFTLEMASAYRELFSTLIQDTRNMLSRVTGYDCGNVPFICGLPKWNTRNSPAPTYQGMVRTAMTTVASEMDNVGCIDCMPLNQHDNWHFDAAGQKYLGEGFVALLETFEVDNDSYFNERVSIDDEIKLLADEKGLEFRANLTNYDSDNGYEYGFIVVPTAKLDEHNINGDYFNSLDAAYINYKRIAAEVKVEKIDENYSNIYFSAKTSEVLYEDLNTCYTAIAYIKNPEGMYMYSSRHVSNSIARLASEKLYQEGADKDALQKIVNAGINFINGVAFENRENNTDFELIVDKALQLTFSEIAPNHQLEVKKSVDVDYFVRYSSSNPKVVSVDENGVLTAHDNGSATITVECAGKSATVEVTVDYISIGGVVFDGVISENEYVGDVISASNSNLHTKFAGMIKDGNLYLSFELIHGPWGALSSNWWDNDNIEFKLNNGTSYKVVFYEGVPNYSSNISHGISKTERIGDKYITIVELCVENVEDIYQLKVGFNGKNNFGWLGAIWHEYHNIGYVSKDGIRVSKSLDLGNGFVLDGNFDESIYTEDVKTNVIKGNANGANVEIMGTLTDKGVVFGVTVDHTKAPNISTDGSNNWYTYMGIEFHFNNGAAQFMALVNNTSSLANIYSYCKTVETDNGYRSTFEIFIPYEAIGVDSTVKSIGFTARGWFETGWCNLLNTSWDATHNVSANGLSKITK